MITPPAGGEHQFRRPGFLRALNRLQYMEFYEQMQDKDPATLAKSDSPEGLTKAIISVGQPLSQLYRHILFWYKPDFEVPIGAQYTRLKAYDVEVELQAVAFAVPELDVERTMIEEDVTLEEAMAAHKTRQKAAQLKMLNLERKLTAKICERKDVFDVLANTKVSSHSFIIHNCRWTPL